MANEEIKVGDIMNKDEIEEIKDSIQQYKILNKNRKVFYDKLIEVCKKHYDYLGVSIIENDNETNLKLEFLLNKFEIIPKLIKDHDYKILLSFNKIVTEKNCETHINLGNDIIIDTHGNIVIKGKGMEPASHIDDDYPPGRIITMWICNYLKSIKSE